MKKDTLRLSLGLVILVSTFLGLLSGIVGELWINNFLAPDIQFKNYRDLTQRLDELVAEKNKVIKDILNEQDNTFKDVLIHVSATTVKFYNYKTPGSKLSNVYLDKDVIGSGFVLTSDGWLVTDKEVIVNPKAEYSVQIEDKIYPVKEIFADVMTDIVLAKIDANNLASADLGTKESLSVGQTLMVTTAGRGVKKVSVDNLSYFELNSLNAVVHSTENFDQFIRLSGEFSNDYLGAPVFTLNGRVVGILTATDGSVVPIDYFTNVMKSIVQKGIVERNFLGINYIDLSHTPNFQASETHGAYVIGDANRLPLIVGSPAAAAGIKAGDIIMKVENEEIDAQNNLTQIVQEYPTKATIKLQVKRGDQWLDVSVTLGEL